MTDDRRTQPRPPGPATPGDLRQRGRPAGSTRAEPSTHVTAWLPVSLYNKLDRLSVRQEQSMSATIRQLLILKL